MSKLKFTFALAFLASCVSIERNNPDDPGSINYQGGYGGLISSSSGGAVAPSSAAVAPSSSSAIVYSSSAVVPSSSSTPPSSSSAVPSSSSVVPSSSSVAPSSSSVAPSSSSAVPSSSSVAPSSSSAVPSSSSVAPSSSSVAPSSSSVASSKGNDIANYKTVQIGDQIWMAENLDYNVSGSECYGRNESNCTIYGRLYTWATAMRLNTSCNGMSCSSIIDPKHQGICPSGWHIPNNTDWGTLVATVGGTTAGTNLKAENGWNNDGNGTDIYEFAALPGGEYSNNAYRNIGNRGHWWSASEYSAGNAYSRSMNHDYEGVYTNYIDKDNYLLSIRCIKD